MPSKEEKQRLERIQFLKRAIFTQAEYIGSLIKELKELEAK